MRTMIETRHIVPVLCRYDAGLAGGTHRSSQSATAPIALAKRIAWPGMIVVDLTLEATTPDGTRVTPSGTTANVARRSADGSWRFTVLNPLGTG
jgi:hypothetical protein